MEHVKWFKPRSKALTTVIHIIDSESISEAKKNANTRALLLDMSIKFDHANFSAPFRFVAIPDYEENASTLYWGLERC